MVTPFAGVWIETDIVLGCDEFVIVSHPSRVCGLKLPLIGGRNNEASGHTLRGCVD